MPYEVISRLRITCGGPLCTGSVDAPGAPAHVELRVDEVVGSETAEEVIRRALAQLPGTRWQMLVSFPRQTLNARPAPGFYCSVQCLRDDVNGEDPRPEPSAV